MILTDPVSFSCLVYLHAYNNFYWKSFWRLGPKLRKRPLKRTDTLATGETRCVAFEISHEIANEETLVMCLALIELVTHWLDAAQPKVSSNTILQGFVKGNKTEDYRVWNTGSKLRLQELPTLTKPDRSQELMHWAAHRSSDWASRRSYFALTQHRRSNCYNLNSSWLT